MIYTQPEQKYKTRFGRDKYLRDFILFTKQHSQIIKVICTDNNFFEDRLYLIQCKGKRINIGYEFPAHIYMSFYQFDYL